MSILKSANFVTSICFCVIELYEFSNNLDIKPLSVRQFANIFSHSVCCLFTVLIIGDTHKGLQSALSVFLSHSALYAQKVDPNYKTHSSLA